MGHFGAPSPRLVAISGRTSQYRDEEVRRAKFTNDGHAVQEELVHRVARVVVLLDILPRPFDCVLTEKVVAVQDLIPGPIQQPEEGRGHAVALDVARVPGQQGEEEVQAAVVDISKILRILHLTEFYFYMLTKSLLYSCANS